MKTYMVINKETEISVEGFLNKEDAEKKAAFMTEYHQRKYIVVEVKK